VLADVECIRLIPTRMGTMRFDKYVRLISKNGEAPRDVDRPKAIRVGAAEGYVAPAHGRELRAPSPETVARRVARVRSAQTPAA
jgi:hypothetical protein